jgi:hypothetical protein
MTTINDVYAALQQNSRPLTLSNLIDAVEDNTGVRPQRKQVCHAASQLTREGFAVRVRNGVYRAARQGSTPLPVSVMDGASTTPVLVSAQQPPSGEACNLSHAEILQLLFGPQFEPGNDQVPLVRELTHAIDGINRSLRKSAWAIDRGA